jgi:hypothetical protein
MNNKSFFWNEQYTWLQLWWELFICDVLFYHMMHDKSFFSNEQYTRSKPLLHDLFVICCSIIWWTINLSFEMSNILDQNCGENCSFVICCSMIWWTINLSFEMSNILDQNCSENYSFVMRCSIKWCTINLSFEMSNILDQILCYTIYLWSVILSYDERSIFLLKWAIYSIKTFIRAIHLWCVLSSYDER